MGRSHLINITALTVTGTQQTTLHKTYIGQLPRRTPLTGIVTDAQLEAKIAGLDFTLRN